LAPHSIIAASPTVLASEAKRPGSVVSEHVVRLPHVSAFEGNEGIISEWPKTACSTSRSGAASMLAVVADPLALTNPLPQL
tara:strand:+ start:300 stop:542 length:243 start_codon:yes stop_codon:yes gene_type:complete